MCKRVLCLMMLCVLGSAYVASAGGLVAWWKLDEGTGTVVNDSSGNNITGNLIGTPKWVAGKIGGAIEFDGKSWIDFGNPPKTLMTGTTPVAVALWIYPTNLGTLRATSGHDRAFLWRNQDWAFKASGPYARFTTPGVLDYDAMNTVLKTNEWQHVAVVFQPGSGTYGVATFHLNGVQTDRVQSTTTANGGYNAAAATVAASTVTGGHVALGNNQWSTAASNQAFFGSQDDVQLYDRLLTPSHIQEIYAGGRATFARAEGPNPADQATGVSQALFQWIAGEGAVFHNVYVGTTPELTEANLGGSKLPFAMYFHTAGLQPGAVHYWRVDEIDAAGNVTKGDVWSFTATPATAWAQKPVDGAPYLPDTTTLEWSAGMNAMTHDVYLSTDRAAVEAGAATAKVGDKLPTATYKATGLERGKDYFWRVDEQVATGGTVAGPVWSFSVRPIMEKTDPNLVAWWKLDEAKSLFAADYSGNDRYGTLVGNPQWVDGYFDDGLKFNGTTDYVDFSTPAALYLPKAYTYSVWFKVAKDIAGNSGAQYLLCNGSRSDLVFGVEDAVGVNGDLSLHYYDTAPGFHAVGVGQTTWRADEWHMVTATKDAAGHKIYLDGELKNSDNNTRDDNYNTTRLISIGARGWTNPKVAFFNGTLDDVRVYNKALNADEIKQLMRGDPRIAWSPEPKSTATLDIRDAARLTWSAGDTAAKHDVYFGQDKDALKTADPTSPLYQGRQTGTSFALDGKVEFGGGSYYWRVDEVEADGATVHKGVVWTFTIPGYFIVDDFESYNDQTGSEIFSAWIDGFTNGLSGSTVGYLTATNLTFGETTIVHGGKQSMPMSYDNTKAPFFSEAVQTFASLQDWTGYGVTDLSLWFRGQPATAPFTETAPGQYKFGSNSPDVWGTSDSFAFYYRTLTGDGSISAKVVALTDVTSNTWNKAGVMIRDSLDPDAMYGFMFPTPDGRRAFQNRPVAGANAVSAHSATGQATLPFWVKVERKGNLVTAYYSTDGTTWTRQPDTENTGTDRSLNPQMINMGNSILIGLAVTSNNVAGTKSSYAEFADVVTTGSVSADWKFVRVGTSYSNDPDKLYVVVEDSTGKNAVATYSDPAATTLAAWTEWKIPLSSLTGVNLAKVKNLYLGVGDRKATAPAGTGRMYIDDIRVIKQ
jgi:hypothetical protein